MSKKKESGLKARLYIGGLKSLFHDLGAALEEVEKTGSMDPGLLDALEDVKDAVDLTVTQLRKGKPPCCEHQPAVKTEAEIEAEEDDEEENEALYCEECDEEIFDGQCDCDGCEDGPLVVAPRPPVKQPKEEKKTKKPKGPTVH